ILSLLKDIQQSRQMSILLITHDLQIAKIMADRIAVMYAGHLVETSSVDDFFKLPAHPYSSQLLEALPDNKQKKTALTVILGRVPPLSSEFQRCRFLPRCRYADTLCHQCIPPWKTVSSEHRTRCHYPVAQIKE